MSHSIIVAQDESNTNAVAEELEVSLSSSSYYFHKFLLENGGGLRRIVVNTSTIVLLFRFSVIIVISVASLSADLDVHDQMTNLMKYIFMSNGKSTVSTN